MMKRKRQSYDITFKLKVIEYAKANTNRAAEREFSVSEKMVRDWRLKEEKMRKADVKSIKKMRMVLSPYDDLEMDLKDWLVDNRSNGFIITRNAIRLKALQYAKERKETEFKASAGWCTNFMKRHNLTLQQRTHIAQKLPKDVDAKVDNFHRYLIDLRKNHDFALSAIGNMDETPLFFDMVGTRTVDCKGANTVSVKTTGNDKAHFTTILACLADGTKLTPAVVFKRKTLPKDQIPAGVIVYVQDKGWVDEAICTKWLNDVWFKRPGAMLNGKSLLVWDMFRAHLVSSVKDKLKERRSYQAVIPGGCTSVLQPLDVCINKPFKVNMRQKWNDWMINGQKELTKAGNLKRPEIKTVCEWVKRSWDEIPCDVVVKSFLKCGISNSMDGTEDDELFSDFVGGRGQSETDQLSDDDQVYDETISPAEFEQLFDETDDEEFEGF